MRWARAVLDSGYYTLKIGQLVGVKATPEEDRFRLFLEILNELKIDLPDDKSQVIEIYVHYLSKKYLRGKVSPRRALEKMFRVLIEVDEEEKERYLPFFNIAVDYDLIKSDTKVNSISGKKKLAFVKALKKEFLNFLEDLHPKKYRFLFSWKRTSKLQEMVRNMNKNTDFLRMLIIKDVLEIRKKERKP